MPIHIGAIAPQAAAGLSTSKPSAASAPGFSESLMHLVDAVDSSAGDANTAVEKMLDGTGDVHDAMIALQRADMTLQFSVQVKNKFVQAYQEIMRMPV